MLFEANRFCSGRAAKRRSLRFRSKVQYHHLLLDMRTILNRGGKPLNPLAFFYAMAEGFIRRASIITLKIAAVQFERKIPENRYKNDETMGLQVMTIYITRDHHRSSITYASRSKNRSPLPSIPWDSRRELCRRDGGVGRGWEKEGP